MEREFSVTTQTNPAWVDVSPAAGFSMIVSSTHGGSG